MIGLAAEQPSRKVGPKSLDRDKERERAKEVVCDRGGRPGEGADEGESMDPGGPPEESAKKKSRKKRSELTRSWSSAY